ncbi:MAG TPA: hypothetical protein VL461_13050 [Dictyobacter sp.]|jgi:hypothetical protein|nr:hypothetical protein [Dictyobacter sp.]
MESQVKVTPQQDFLMVVLPHCELQGHSNSADMHSSRIEQQPVSIVAASSSNTATRFALLESLDVYVLSQFLEG